MSGDAVFPACGRVAAWAERHPGVVLGVLGAVTVVSIVLMGRLSFSGALGVVVGEASPAARAIATIGERFDVGEDLLVLATALGDPNGADARASLGAFAVGFERELRADPRSGALVRTVTWRRDSFGAAWLDDVALPGAPILLDEQGFNTFLDRLSDRGIRDRVRRVETLLAAPGLLAQTAAVEAIEDPLDIRGLLLKPFRRDAGEFANAASDELVLSRDGRSLLIRVSPLAGPDDLDASKRLLSLVSDVVDRSGRQDTRIVLTGAPAIAAQSASSIRSDLIRSVVGAVIVVQVLFLLAYRGALAFVVVMLPAGLGIVWAFGAVALFGGRLTGLSAAIGAILVGLGVDYAVHVASSMGADGGSRGNAATRAVARVGPGIVGAAATTIIAFGVLTTSRIEILHAFAAIGSAGLIGAVVATVLLMPIVLAGGIRARRPALMGSGLLRGQGVSVLLAASALMAGVSVVSTAVVAFGPDGPSGLIPLDDRLDAMHPSPAPALEAQRLVDAAFPSSGEGLPVLVEARDDDGLVRKAHDVRRALQSTEAIEAGVRGVVGIDGLLPNPEVIEARRARLSSLDINRIRDDFRRAADESLIATGVFDDAVDRLEAMIRAPKAPTIDDLRAHPNLARLFLPVDGTEAAAAISYVLLDRSVDSRSDRARVVGTIAGLLDRGPGATLTGLSALGYETERLAIQEMPRLLSLALLGILVWLGVYYRRWADVLLTLVPGAFAFIVLLALLAPLGIRLNIVNMAAFPLLVGIGMDDGIFLVSAARASRDAPDRVGALRERFGYESHAIVITSLTTILGFGSLMLTSTPAVRSLGLLVGIGVMACLWGSLFLLAPLLILIAARGDTQARGLKL